MGHDTRAEIAPEHPVVVMLGFKRELGNMRRRRVHEVIRGCVRQSADRPGFRICHYSVQAHGLRLLVEAADRQTLSRAMQGLGVRLARALNRLSGRSGTVLSDRYDTAVLTTATAVRAGLCFVLNSHVTGPGVHGFDPYSSAAYFDGWKDVPAPSLSDPAEARLVPVAAPRTALLRKLWRNRGLLRPGEAPPARL